MKVFLVVTRAVLEYYWARDEIKKWAPNARESKGYTIKNSKFIELNERELLQLKIKFKTTNSYKKHFPPLDEKSLMIMSTSIFLVRFKI